MIAKKGRNRRRLISTRVAQKAINVAMQRKGWSKAAKRRRKTPTEDVARKTTKRRVSTAANPKRHSLIHHQKLNTIPKITPRIMKNSQKNHPKRESATVRLRT
jgi:hypothetical protein